MHQCLSKHLRLANISKQFNKGLVRTVGSMSRAHNPPTPGNKKHKRNVLEGDIDINAPWKTCGICINYRNLHDPYPDEENEENFLTMEDVFAIIAGDELTSLKDAKNSPDW